MLPVLDLNPHPRTARKVHESAKLAPANAELLWEITTRYADPAHRDHLVEGLRKAGFTV